MMMFGVVYVSVMTFPVYFMVGLRHEVVKFCYFLMGMMLLTSIGNSLGLVIGAISKDLVAAQNMLMPLLVPLLMFSGFLIPLNQSKLIVYSSILDLIAYHTWYTHYHILSNTYSHITPSIHIIHPFTHLLFTHTHTFTPSHTYFSHKHTHSFPSANRVQTLLLLVLLPVRHGLVRGDALPRPGVCGPQPGQIPCVQDRGPVLEVHRHVP